MEWNYATNTVGSIQQYHWRMILFYHWKKIVNLSDCRHFHNNHVSVYPGKSGPRDVCTCAYMPLRACGGHGTIAEVSSLLLAGSPKLSCFEASALY